MLNINCNILGLVFHKRSGCADWPSYVLVSVVIDPRSRAWYNANANANESCMRHFSLPSNTDGVSFFVTENIVKYLPSLLLVRELRIEEKLIPLLHSHTFGSVTHRSPTLPSLFLILGSYFSRHPILYRICSLSFLFPSWFHHRISNFLLFNFLGN